MKKLRKKVKLVKNVNLYAVNIEKTNTATLC